jgi:hypothetical protein
MFEVLGAKRVKRSHLFQEEDVEESDASSRPLEPLALEIGVHDKHTKVDYGFDYEFITSDAVPVASTSKVVNEEDGSNEPEFQFRLFNTTAKKDATSQSSKIVANHKIRLSATPEPEVTTEAPSLQQARFVQPNRPDPYYFTAASSAAVKSQYQEAALTTGDVLCGANISWPGAALPWRCIQVRLAKSCKPRYNCSKSKTNTLILEERKRARPSKKRRTILKRRQELRNELAAQSKAAEETEREKRTRRNREKKVKRKERDKKKNADLGRAVEGEDDDDVEDDGRQVVAAIPNAAASLQAGVQRQEPPGPPTTTSQSIAKQAIAATASALTQRTPTAQAPAVARKVHPTAKAR